MANQKISALNSATTTDGTEVLPVVQSAETKKMAVSVIKDYLLSVAGTFTNKTIEAPVINDPTITGGRIFNAEIVLQAAVWHSNTVSGVATIPENCNAVSIPPVLIPPGAAVNVGAGSTWSFLSI